MIIITIKNPPVSAMYWTPEIVKAGIPYYPAANLALNQTWETSIFGDVDAFRIIVYNASNAIIDTKTLFNVTLEDNKTYIFDWVAGNFTGAGVNWLMWAGIGAGAFLLGILIARGTKR